MPARATLDTNSAFVLRPESIRRLWTLLTDKAGPVEAVALCADGIEREFSTDEDLINYANFPAQRIMGLQLGVWGEDGERASITFTRHRPSVRFSASGSENDVAILRQHIANIAEGIKPWYSFVAKIPEWIAPYMLLGISMVVLTVAMVLPGRRNHTPLGGSTVVLIMLSMIFGTAILAGGLAWLNTLRVKLFPMATFALGAGVERHQTGENIRWCVIIGFFVSLAAGFVVALILQ